MSTAQEPAKLVETQIPSVDGYSLTRSTPAPQSASNTLTPEEIAREAYAAYMDARVDPETAFSRVQAKTAERSSLLGKLQDKKEQIERNAPAIGQNKQRQAGLVM